MQLAWQPAAKMSSFQCQGERQNGWIMRVVGAYSICLLLAIVAVACGITVVLSVLFRSSEQETF